MPSDYEWIDSLPKIRKRYRNQVVDPEKLSNNECWNVEIDGQTLTFHYYWEDDENIYVNYIMIDLNEDMTIAHIYPIDAQRQNYCDFRRSDYSPCRATDVHYMKLDSHLEDACTPKK